MSDSTVDDPSVPAGYVKHAEFFVLDKGDIACLERIANATERIATALEGLQPHVSVVGCRSVEVSRGADAEAMTEAVRELVREQQVRIRDEAAAEVLRLDGLKCQDEA